MSIDFEVQIQPGSTSNNIVLSLSANDPGLNLNREKFLRSTFTLDANDMKELRSGDATLDLMNRVSKQMTTWFLDKDMKGYLHAHVYGTEPVRLIFRTDEELLDRMADLPLELLRFRDNDWLVLLQAVSAIVHELPFTSLPKEPNRSKPLKILVVRASPSGLSVKVPPAAPICNHIIKLGNELGPNTVHVDLLSREVTSLAPGQTWEEFEYSHLPHLVIDEAEDSFDIKEMKQGLKWKEFREYLLSRQVETLLPGTWDRFMKQLKENSTNYHIIVYLGHGNHIRIDGSQNKIGVLQFETPDGEGVRSVSSHQLHERLQERNVPVPVVLLVGCLTAAEIGTLDPEIRKIVTQNIAEWTFGSQGVAQSLVNRATGVQCAVGMRYQIETTAAFAFLKTFFESLLTGTRGNVEAAVRAGRSELFGQRESPPSWSAPVIFRTRGIEPIFKFLADIPKTYKPDRDDVKDQEIREAAWTSLIQDPHQDFAYQILAEREEKMRAKMIAAGGALVMPRMTTTGPGEPVQVAIELFGQLFVEMLACKLSINGPASATIQAVHSTQPLKNSGFVLKDISEAGESEIRFSIKKEGTATKLPPGEILITTLQVGTVIPGKYTVDLNVTDVEPDDTRLRSVNNVVLVVPSV